MNEFKGFARIYFIEIVIKVVVIEILIEIDIEFVIVIEIKTAISYKTSYDLNIAKLCGAAWTVRFFYF